MLKTLPQEAGLGWCAAEWNAPPEHEEHVRKLLEVQNHGTRVQEILC